MKSLIKSSVGRISTTAAFLMVIIISILILKQAGIVKAQNESATGYDAINLEVRGDVVRATLISDSGVAVENQQIDFYLNDTMLGSGLTNAEGFVDFPVSNEGILKVVLNSGSIENETMIGTKAISEPVNVTQGEAENNLGAEQQEAEINKPVRWAMKSKGNAKAFAPEKSFNVSVQNENIEYYTDAPTSYETVLSKYRKLVTVSSDIDYTNIKTYTSIEDTPRNSIRLFWLEDNKRTDVTNDPSINLTLVDTNGNGLIDRLEWITPHTSNQTFEVDIIILNPYTYLRNGENWIVAFNTTGQADLIINSTNANWTEFLTDNPSTYDEMKFLDISCGNTSLKDSLELADENENIYNYSQLTESDSIKIKKLLIRNYSCDYTGYITNNMLKAGYAILQFSFGDQTAYAHDPDFTLCNYNITWTSNYTNNISSIGNGNNTYYCLNQSWYITNVTAINFTNIQNSTLDCLGYSITGNQTTGAYGALLTTSSINNTVKNCNFTNFTYGIYISVGSDNSTIFNNVLSNESSYGIYQTNSNYANISNNIANYNSGIYLTGTSRNNVLINNTFNGLYGNTYGVRLYSSNNTLINNTANYHRYCFDISGNYNTFINNTAKPGSGSFAWGIQLSVSAYNNFTNNNFIGGSTAGSDYLFYLTTSNYTSVTGGSIYNSTSSGADYEIGANNGVGNNFTNTNFTGARKITFTDSTGWFNYQNDSTQNLWLSNNVSAAATLTRTLNKWNQYNMSWNESASVSTTANYNITGFVTNKNYTVYNNSVFRYRINASSCGCINFTIDISTSSQTIQVNATDSESPTYSLNSTNSTSAGTPVMHSLNWNDNGGLSGYIFSFWNGTDYNRTPTSVYNKSGEEPSIYWANRTIDGNLGSYDSEECPFKNEHWE